MKTTTIVFIGTSIVMGCLKFFGKLKLRSMASAKGHWRPSCPGISGVGTYLHLQHFCRPHITSCRRGSLHRNQSRSTNCTFQRCWEGWTPSSRTEFSVQVLQRYVWYVRCCSCWSWTMQTSTRRTSEQTSWMGVGVSSPKLWESHTLSQHETYKGIVSQPKLKDLRKKETFNLCRRVNSKCLIYSWVA